MSSISKNTYRFKELIVQIIIVIGLIFLLKLFKGFLSDALQNNSHRRLQFHPYFHHY